MDTEPEEPSRSNSDLREAQAKQAMGATTGLMRMMLAPRCRAARRIEPPVEGDTAPSGRLARLWRRLTRLVRRRTN